MASQVSESPNAPRIHRDSPQQLWAEYKQVQARVQRITVAYFESLSLAIDDGKSWEEWCAINKATPEEAEQIRTAWQIISKIAVESHLRLSMAQEEDTPPQEEVALVGA